MRCRPEWCGGEEVSICGAGWSCGSSMGSCRLIPPAEWHPSPASFTLPCWWHPLCAHASGYQRNKLEALWMKVQGSRSWLTKSAHYSWRNCLMYISSLFWRRSLSYEKETWMMLLQKLLAKQWSLLFSPVAKSGLAACCFWGCTDLIQERLCPLPLWTVSQHVRQPPQCTGVIYLLLAKNTCEHSRGASTSHSVALSLEMISVFLYCIYLESKVSDVSGIILPLLRWLSFCWYSTPMDLAHSLENVDSKYS